MSSEESLSKDSDSLQPSDTTEGVVAAEPVHDDPPSPEQAEQTDQPHTDLESDSREVPDSAADSSTSSEPTPTDSSDDSQKQPSRRPRLNPTLNKETAKAVPSLSPSGSPSTRHTPPAGESEVADSDSKTEAKPQSNAPLKVENPVDLPPEIGDLGRDLDAEIEAALSSGSLESPSTEIQTSTDDVDSLLEEDALEEGTKLTGKIQSVHGDDVFLDLGSRSPGVVSSRQFESGKKPVVGQIIEVVVSRVDHEEGLIQLNLPKGIRKARGNWEDLAAGQIVDCMVTKTNKGGLEVTVGSIRGFLPSSQVDLAYVSDLEQFVGQKLRVKVLEANPRKRNLVLSRRDFLLIERKESEEQLWKTLEVGLQFTGTVKSIKDYGAFVDIGGVDGFLHIGEISWSRINHPSEVLQDGQQIEVKVLTLDPEKKRISLGMRQLVPNPWTIASVNYPVESTVSGKITRITDFGAFVELEPGLEGMVHISELDHKRVRQVSDVLTVGQQINFKVLEVNPDRKRIGLSLKALVEKPEEQIPAGQTASEETPASMPKRNKPLKGGTGKPARKGGGLFGNPNDF
ncbi:MAG: S1 RNA-binding domain-containing protein [Planctomycetes bacterium]|nr:S1 RNA-binding domain-containing protein [Planctomycetota bacterium]